MPDEVWISAERLGAMPDDAEVSPVTPEVVVEVSTEENTETETKDNRRLDHEGGAQEVWTCIPGGPKAFYHDTGTTEASKVVASFPKEIDER